MKKLVTLLLAAGLAFSAASTASAVEVQASGSMNFAFQASQNIYSPFQDYRDGGGHQKHFEAVQRFRLGLDFIMSENLSAHYQAQVGTFTWGGPASGSYRSGGNANEALGGALGTRAANIVTRFAYLDWVIPTTDIKVRMGQQPVALPSFTFGSPVLDDPATGIMISVPVTDNVGLTGMWLRAYSDPRRGSTAGLTDRRDDNVDLFGLVADLKFDGLNVQPWAVVGTVGKDTGADFYAVDKNSVAWFAGISGELTMFDPFRLTADFYYSGLDGERGDSGRDYSGWYAALGAEYQTAYGTPALKGWYATGDGKNDKVRGAGQPLTLSGGFNPTSTYFDGRFSSMPATIDYSAAGGTWGISAQWNGLSFVDALSHDISVTYFQGTNNKNHMIEPGSYLTTKDAAVEIDFNTTYQVYQNLATVLELGYIIEDFDTGNATRNGYPAAPGSDKAKFSNAWRAAMNFQYTF